MAFYRRLFIDFDSFYASVEQQDNEEYRGKPIIVVPVVCDYTCAIAASYQAKRLGVKTGTRVSVAKDKIPAVIKELKSLSDLLVFYNLFLMHFYNLLLYLYL